MPRYIAKTRIKGLSRKVMPGDEVELEAGEETDDLVRCGALSQVPASVSAPKAPEAAEAAEAAALVPPAPASDSSPDTAPAPAPASTAAQDEGDQPALADRIVACIRKMDVNDEEQYDKAGRPRVRHIEKALGVNINAAQRDTAWALVQSEQ